MAHASRRTGLRIGRPIQIVVAGLVLAACSGTFDGDPSTIGGAEPEELVGDDPETREAPTLTLPDDEPDTRVARPNDLDALAVRDVEGPWYLDAGMTREAVGEVVEDRLADLDRDAICAYLDQEVDRFAHRRMLVPTADVAYPSGEPAAARRLTGRAVIDLLDDQLGVRDLRLASSLTEACDLLVDPELARVAARSSLNRALDLPGTTHVDPRDDGWADGGRGRADGDDGAADGDGIQDQGEGVAIDGATGRPFAEDGPRDARVLAAWQERLAPRTAGLCAWVGAPPAPQDLDAVLARLVQLRGGVAHDGLPSVTEALMATCPALDSLDWSAARPAEPAA